MTDIPKCHGCGKPMRLVDGVYKYSYECADCGWKSPYGVREDKAHALAMRRNQPAGPDLCSLRFCGIIYSINDYYDVCPFYGIDAREKELLAAVRGLIYAQQDHNKKTNNPNLMEEYL